MIPLPICSEADKLNLLDLYIEYFVVSFYVKVYVDNFVSNAKMGIGLNYGLSPKSKNHPNEMLILLCIYDYCRFEQSFPPSRIVVIRK